MASRRLERPIDPRLGFGLLCLALCFLCSCSGPSDDESRPSETKGVPALAEVVAVGVFGGPNYYRLKVTIRSPDTGCDQYANWWEVLSLEGDLLYRRILRHSHVPEQPFTRIGGPVELEPDQVVWVRTHMHPGGYGGKAAKGSIESGFEPADLSADFAAGVADLPPLPDGCAF